MNTDIGQLLRRMTAVLGAGALAAVLTSGSAVGQEPPPAPAVDTPTTEQPLPKARDKSDAPAEKAAPRPRQTEQDQPAVPERPKAARDQVLPGREPVREAREGIREAREEAREARQEVRETRREVQRESRELSADNVRAADLGIWFQRAGQEGLVVADVAAEGAIAKVGFQEGDRIVSVNGQRVISERQFIQLLLAREIRTQRIEVVVLRDGREQVLYVQPAILIQEVVTYDPLYRYGLVIDDRYPDRIVVLRVFPRTPAYYAGLRPGDTIVALRGQRIAAVADLVRAFQQSDSSVALQVNRGNRLRQLEIDVDQADASSEARTTLRPNLDAEAPLEGRSESRLEGRTQGRTQLDGRAKGRVEGRIDVPADQRPQLERPMTDDPATDAPATPRGTTPSRTPKSATPKSPPSTTPRAEAPANPATPAADNPPRSP